MGKLTTKNMYHVDIIRYDNKSIYWAENLFNRKSYLCHSFSGIRGVNLKNFLNFIDLLLAKFPDCDTVSVDNSMEFYSNKLQDHLHQQGVTLEFQPNRSLFRKREIAKLSGSFGKAKRG